MTSGRPALVAVQPADPAVSEDELLGWLAGLESGSEHSLAAAMVAEAGARGLEVGTGARAAASSPARASAAPSLRGGAGARGAGRQRGALRRPPVPCRAPGADVTAVVVAWDGRPRGRVLLRDAPRPDAAEAVAALGHAGIRTVLLSGDRSGGGARGGPAASASTRWRRPARPRRSWTTCAARRPMDTWPAMVGRRHQRRAGAEGGAGRHSAGGRHGPGAPGGQRRAAL